MPPNPTLIIELPSGGTVDRQLRGNPPRSVSDGDVVLVPLAADADGRLPAPAAGEVVLSVPSPESLAREPAVVRRVIDGAGTGDEPLVVVVEAAEELRDEELAAVLDAARRARRQVILRLAAEA